MLFSNPQPIAPPPDAILNPPEHPLHVSVVFTSVTATLKALKEAAHLAAGLNARMSLVVPQIVPYPLPLDKPPLHAEPNESRFRVLTGGIPVETNVRICLCRDRVEALISVLDRHSIVVVGGRRRWWRPSGDAALARKLRRSGFDVVFMSA
jgi:hypothetical protein